MSDPNYISEERFNEIIQPFAALVPGANTDDILNLTILDESIHINVREYRDTPSRIRMPVCAIYQIHINKDKNDDD